MPMYVRLPTLNPMDGQSAADIHREIYADSVMVTPLSPKQLISVQIRVGAPVIPR